MLSRDRSPVPSSATIHNYRYFGLRGSRSVPAAAGMDTAAITGESHWIPASPASSRNSVSSTSPSSSNSSMAWRMSQVPDERVGRRQSGAVVENHAFFWGKQLSQSNSGQTHLGGKKHTFSVFYCFRESLRCNNLGLEVGEATNEVQQFLAE